MKKNELKQPTFRVVSSPYRLPYTVQVRWYAAISTWTFSDISNFTSYAFKHIQIANRLWFDMHTDLVASSVIRTPNSIYGHIQSICGNWIYGNSWAVHFVRSLTYSHHTGQKELRCHSGDGWSASNGSQCECARDITLLRDVFYSLYYNTFWRDWTWKGKKAGLTFSEAQCRKMAKQRYHIWVVFSLFVFFFLDWDERYRPFDRLILRIGRWEINIPFDYIHWAAHIRPVDLVVVFSYSFDHFSLTMSDYFTVCMLITGRLIFT